MIKTQNVKLKRRMRFAIETPRLFVGDVREKQKMNIKDVP